MTYFTSKTFKTLMTVVSCSAVLAISSSAYAHATSQSPQAESLTNVSETEVASSPIILADASPAAQARKLTGVWNCDDGGVYFIRQVGNQIWWYGQSGDGGDTWSNVFQGTIRGNTIIGSWADVPKGSIKGYGEMTLKLSGDRLQKISGGENFGGGVWSR